MFTNRCHSHHAPETITARRGLIFIDEGCLRLYGGRVLGRASSSHRAHQLLADELEIQETFSFES